MRFVIRMALITACRKCDQPLPARIGPGRPRLTCEPCLKGPAKPSKADPATQAEKKARLAREKRAADRLARHGATCRQCGNPLNGRNSPFCSIRCQRGMRAPGVATCPNCEDVFFQRRAYEVFCGRTCARQTHLRIKSAKRRSVYHAVEVLEQVDPIAVFVRDAWTCQACGELTPEALRGQHKPRSPELDHKIPITRGGSHTYDNTQCLCRACNGAKGDMTMCEFMEILNSRA